MSTSNDFVPRNDAEFDGWQSRLVAEVNTNKEKWEINTADYTDLTERQKPWTAIILVASNKQNRTSANVAEKDECRLSYEKYLRNFVAQHLANNSKVSDSDRVRMGLTVKSGTRTPSPVPTTSPIASLDFSVRMQHTIHYFDEATPRSKAKPPGVHGCEIYFKTDGEAPVDSSELTYLATNTASPYLINFDGKHVGKVIYYRLRWVNSRGERGPWSSIISSLVVG